MLEENRSREFNKNETNPTDFIREREPYLTAGGNIFQMGFIYSNVQLALSFDRYVSRRRVLFFSRMQIWK